MAGLLVIGGVLLMYITRGTTFLNDEWIWIFQRRGSGLGTFLDTHNGHLSLVPVAVYKLLFATAGLGHYWPYRVVVIAAHLMCVSLVFVYARSRVGGLFALLAAALILFFGPGWQDFLWPFQMAWLFAIAAGIGSLMMLERGDTTGDVGACALLCVSLASAGPGIAFAAGVAVELLVRRRWRDWWIVAVPAVLYAVWWVLYQHSTLAGQAVSRLPRFVYTAAASALSAVAGLSHVNAATGTGAFLTWGRPLLALGLLGLVWRLRRLGSMPVRVIALLTIMLSFWVITGLARAYFVANGLPFQSSGDDNRYLYVGAVLIVLIAVELASGARRSLPISVVAAIVVLVAIVSNSGVLGAAGGALRLDAQTTEAYLGTLDLTRGTVKPEFLSQVSEFAPPVRAEEYFDVERALGSPAASAAQIAAMPDAVRMKVDTQLIAIHRLHLVPAKRVAVGRSGAGRTDAVDRSSLSVIGPCVSLARTAVTRPVAAGTPELTIPSRGLLLTALGGPAIVEVRRFSTGFQPVGILASSASATLRIAPDLAAQRWHARVLTAGRASVCSLG